MRCWRTSDGCFLVEGAVVAVGGLCRGFRDPAGRVIRQGHDYYLRDAEGTVLLTFPSRSWVTQEVVGESTFVVDGDRLHEWRCESEDGEPGGPASDQVYLDGLELLAEAPAFGRSLADALATRPQRERRERRDLAAEREERLLLRELSELPILPEQTEIEAVIECEADRELVLRLNGAEVWRELISEGGRGRPEVIEALLRARYGGRLRAFRSTIDYDWLFGT